MSARTVVEDEEQQPSQLKRRDAKFNLCLTERERKWETGENKTDPHSVVVVYQTWQRPFFLCRRLFGPTDNLCES